MQKQEQDLRERTKDFALGVLRMFSSLPKTTEAQVLGKQVLRSVVGGDLVQREKLSPLRNEWSDWGERHAR